MNAMNDDELEKRLAALRPAELPGEVAAELAGLRPTTEARGRGKIVRFLAVLTPLAAAALWLAVAWIPRAPDAKPAGPSIEPGDLRVFVPVEQTSTLVDVEEIGVIDAEPSQPFRLVRATWVDDVTYAGDDGRSTLRRQEPRAEIIPVALETF